MDEIKRLFGLDVASSDDGPGPSIRAVTIVDGDVRPGDLSAHEQYVSRISRYLLESNNSLITALDSSMVFPTQLSSVSMSILLRDPNQSVLETSSSSKMAIAVVLGDLTGPQMGLSWCSGS